jgi:hypothetical protein
MSDVRYVVTDQEVTRQAKQGASWRNVDSRPAPDVWAKLSNSVNTELLPPGIRLLRQVGQYTQIVLECPPAINRICWSNSEYEGMSGRFAVHLVAQPYRVIQAHYNGDQMIGARMFYRPAPLYSLGDVLYHANLPNVNCNGYHNTAVGWVCFYRDGRAQANWPDKIHRLLERCSGAEGYNGNMRNIDGKHFYANAGAPVWRSRVTDWEKKSEKEGVGVALQDGVWLPILVTDQDHQLQHDPRGKPLTLGMAVNGVTPIAYNDPGRLPAVERHRAGVHAPLTQLTAAYTSTRMAG